MSSDKEPASRVAVQLRDGKRRTFEGFTDNAARAESGELLVEFPRKGAPALARGSEVELDVKVGRRSTAYAGTIDTRIDTPLTRRYRIHVRPSGPALLPPGGNRRDAFRVRPPVGNDVAVTLQPLGADDAPSGRPFQCRLRDISSAGIAVILGSEDRARLEPLQRVSFRFELPGRDEESEPQEVRLEGNVRYCRRLGLMTHAGIQYEGERGPTFQRMIDVITRYVIRRQIEQLERERRDESAA